MTTAGKSLNRFCPSPKQAVRGGVAVDNRKVLESILWVLRTSARWQDLPDRYPTSTCWRRLRLWEEQGIWLDIWRKFLALLDEAQLLDWQEAFIDGRSILLGGMLASASSAEVRLAEETLEAVKVPRRGRGRPRKRPMRLIADKGYDSDPLRKRLKALKTDLIVPHRCNRKKLKTQDGRKFRRYRRRWKAERTFAWLGNFRRLIVRHERRIDVYRALFHLACIMIVLRWF